MTAPRRTRYAKCLYKYPQAEFPYEQLVEENARRGRHEPEFELLDTGVFDDNRYFDVVVEYAKADVDDVRVRIGVTNHGPDPARIDVLPTVWFRNTWSWGTDTPRPRLSHVPGSAPTIALEEPQLGQRWVHFDGSPQLLFTENETNNERVFGTVSESPYTKDAFHRFIVDGELTAVNPAECGTKAAARYSLEVPAGATIVLKLRLTDRAPDYQDAFRNFDETFDRRIAEADEFYDGVLSTAATADARMVARQAFGGAAVVEAVLSLRREAVARRATRAQPVPPEERRRGRNRDWTHLYNADVISMPDKWEYPWYASWDLAFHCVPLALVDSDFAKEQLIAAPA